MTILAKLGGRKFLAALFGTLAIALHSWLGINIEAVMTIGAVVSAYVFGQSLAEGFSGTGTSSVTQLAKQDSIKETK